jgi:CelD/BcsL family acetyltransferase involved in cellulose biosynthesis
MSAVETEIIERSDDLEALASDWWALWRRIPAALPFTSPAWLIPWWRHFAPGRLFTIAARRGGRLVGLALFYIEDGALGRRLLPLGISLSDHLDILADPDCAEDALRAIADAAGGRAGEWDAWELEELPPGAAALRMPVPAGSTSAAIDQSACPILAAPSGTRDLAAVVPRRQRQLLALARNRAGRRGGLGIECADGDGVVAPALEHLFRLHGARWASRNEPGVVSTEKARAFHRDAASALAAAGLLRLFLLRFGEQVAAAHYGITHAGRAYTYLTGFDPDFAFESPGALIMAHALQQALDEGCTELDLLRGREDYKYRWGAVDRWNVKRSIRRTDHA